MSKHDPTEILRYALHLSELPSYKFSAKEVKKPPRRDKKGRETKQSDDFPHVPPFVAQIACGNHMLRIDNIECARVELEGAMCDLMLRHFYPGEHVITNVEALQMQWSSQVMGPGSLEDFQIEVDKFRNRFKGMNREKRKRRIDSPTDKYSLVDYEQAISFRKLKSIKNQNWAIICSEICTCHRLNIKWELQLDNPRARQIERLVGRFQIFAPKEGEWGAGGNDRNWAKTQLFNIVLDHIRPEGDINKMAFKFALSKRVLQVLEWHGIIPELEYSKWDEYKEKFVDSLEKKWEDWENKEFEGQKFKQETHGKLKQETVTVWKPIKMEAGEFVSKKCVPKDSAWAKVGGGYNNPNDKSYDNQPIVIEDDEGDTMTYAPVQETWTLLPTCLDTSDEEWEDDEAFENSDDEDEENEKNSSSNFTCNFRKWYKSKPVPTLPEPDFAEFKARKPFLSPGSHAGYHLDYITWAQFGFDGTRKTPLIKRKSDSNENPVTKVKLDGFGNPIKIDQNLSSSFNAEAGKILNKTRKHVNFQYDYSRTQATFDQESEMLADQKRTQNEAAVREHLECSAESVEVKKIQRLARARRAMDILRGKMEARQFAQDNSAQCPRSWALIGDHLSL